MNLIRSIDHVGFGMRTLALLFLATTIAAIPPDRIPPSTPSGLTATAPSCHQVDLAWTGSTDNVGGSGLRGYRIYRGNIFVIEVSVTSFSQMDLAGGTNYSYTVSAIDKAGNESPSTPSVSVSTPKCPPGYCNYVLLPGWSTTGPQAESDDINVLTGTNCAWTVTSSAPWLTATPTSGTGPGWVTWASATNSSIAERRATLTIGGKTFTLAQVGNASSGGTNGQLKWVKGQTTCAGSVNSVKVDHASNVISVGYYRGTIDFGTGPISWAGGSIGDMFIAKFSPQGAILWAKGVGGAYDDAAQSVSIDSSDNIIVTGYFNSTVNFDGTTLTNSGGTDIFVAKFSPSGSLTWVKSFGGVSQDWGRAVTVDTRINPNTGRAYDDILLAASFAVSANFDGIILTCAYGTGMALAKLSPGGNVVWAKSWGAGQSIPHGLAVDRNGDIVVTGQFAGSTDLGGGTLGDPSFYNLFVAKYSGTDGSYRWANATGSTGSNLGSGVAIDTITGNALITGTVQGTVNLGNGSITTVGASLFAAGYNGNGACVWSKVFANGDSFTTASGAGVTVDADGTIALTGQLNGTINVGEGQWLIGSGGNQNFLLATFSPASGSTPPTYRWGKCLGGSGQSSGNGVAFDASAHVLCGGLFSLTKDFGGVSLTGVSVGSPFTAQYNK